MNRVRTNTDPRLIERRILDALIYLMHVRRWQPHAIVLAKDDMKQFRAARRTARAREQVAGIPVRPGKRSIFYGTCHHGVMI